MTPGPLADDALAGQLASALSTALQSPVQVRLCDSRIFSSEDFSASLEDPSCCFDVAAETESSDGLTLVGQVEICPQIAMPMIERMLGGNPRELSAEHRPLTFIERRLLRRLTGLVIEGTASLWPNGRGLVMDDGEEAQSTAHALLHAGKPARPTTAQSAAHALLHAGKPARPTMAQSAAYAPAGGVTVLSFHVQMGLCAGAIRLGLSEAVASPPTQKDQHPRGPVELTVGLPQTTITALEASQLAAGDILATDLDADGGVIVRVGGIPKFVGQLGIYEGKRAITIIRRIE